MNDTDIEGAPLEPMPAPAYEWTDERIEQLVTLWTNGHTAKEIGRRLGTSKNAICGKARRLQLKPRPSPLAGKRSMLTRGLNDSQLGVYAAHRRKGLMPYDARAEALKSK
jgi:GcrA cell cycle regulator